MVSSVESIRYKKSYEAKFYMNDLVEKQIGEVLLRKGWHLAVAESCSGGLLSHRITNIPGSSLYFTGGVVAYSNRVKSDLLGITASLLKSRGAVSAEVALAMARGARRALQAEVGIGITGIAGPGGGTPQKPVGLVFEAVVTPKGEKVRTFHFSGTRLQIKEKVTRAALRLLHKVVSAAS